MVRGYQVACLLIFTVMAISPLIDEVESRPTSAAIPAVTDSAEAVYNTDVFLEPFNLNLNMYDITKQGAGSRVELLGNHLWIDAGNNNNDPKGNNKNMLETCTVEYERAFRHGYHSVYTIETSIILGGSYYRGFRIIDNGDVVVILANDGEIWYYDNNVLTKLCDVPNNQPIKIYAVAFLNTYDLYVDKDGDPEWEKTETTIDHAFYLDKDTFIFGDTSDADYGNAQWQYFRVRGHHLSDIKFYEKFNDGSAENWHYLTEDVWSNVLPDWIYLNDRGNGDPTDYCLEFNDDNNRRNCWARTPPIDIIKDTLDVPYTISLDFYARHNEDYTWFTLLSDRHEVTLYLDSDGPGTDLKIMSHGTYPPGQPSDYVVAIIAPTTWYNLRVEVQGDQYDVYLDDTKMGGPYNVWALEALPALQFGSFGVGEDFDLVRIDNILLEQRTIGIPFDSDNDGLNDGFEVVPHMPLYYDDFNYDRPFEEYGWQHIDRNGMHWEEWEVGFPVVATADPDFGMTCGLPNSQAPEDRSQILGLQIGMPYGTNIDTDLKSPILYIPPGDANSEYRITISFWHWFDFETADDGGAVHIEWWDTDDGVHNLQADYMPGQIQMVPVGGYPCPAIASMPNNNAGFSGTSDGWEFVEFMVNHNFGGQNAYIGMKDVYFRVVFRVTSDDTHTEDWGWYIDDLNIRISSVTNLIAPTYRSDSDGDGIDDGEELYVHGISPMCKDTDFDMIYDGVEINGDNFFGADYGSDPQVRNVLLEIDWLYKDDGYNYNPARNGGTAEYVTIQEGYANHDIYFYFDFEDSIEESDSQASLDYDNGAFNFVDDHATPGNPDTTFTANRLNSWHYCLIAHNDPDDFYGFSYYNAYHCIVYQGEIGSKDPVNNVMCHEMGHSFGMYDYKRSDGWQPPQPPTDHIMNQDRDRDRDSDLPWYFGWESTIWFHCRVDRTNDYNWEANPWCYGGWEYTHQYRRWQSGKWNNCPDGDTGHWMGGLNYDCIKHD